MDCWRCGNPAEEGNECEKCIREQSLTLDGQPLPPSSLIDWTKVKTLDDVREIFTAFGFRVYENSPAYSKLRRFLKD